MIDPVVFPQRRDVFDHAGEGHGNVLDETTDDSLRHSPLSLKQIALFLISFFDSAPSTRSLYVWLRLGRFVDTLGVATAYRHLQAGLLTPLGD